MEENSFDAVSYNILKKKLFDRFNSERITPNGDIVSLLDVIDTLKSFNNYNYVLLDGIFEDVRRMNLKSGYRAFSNNFNKKNPRIGNIEFNVFKDGTCCCEVIFVDENDNQVGSKLLENSDVTGYCLTTINRERANLKKILWNNKKYFDKYFNAMDSFINEFPNIGYRWNYDNPYLPAYRIGDEFISYNCDLNNIKGYHVTFTNLEDISTANIDSPTDSELYDYVEFYNEELAAKTPVNLNDLDSTLKSLVESHLGLNESIKLER